jgi:hypothetical protein
LAVRTDLSHNEVVRRYSFDVPRSQSILRKVPEVVGDDELRPGLDRCRKHMTVVRVRQLDHGFQGLIVPDEAVPNGAHHQFPRPGQPGRVELRAVGLEIGEDLVEDLIRPFRLNEARLSQADQQVRKVFG